MLRLSMKILDSFLRRLTLYAVLIVLPIAILIHKYPGSPMVFKAFIDKGTYAVLTHNSYSQWLDMHKRYYGQEVVTFEDIGLPPLIGYNQERITAINFYVNNIQYMFDEDNYGHAEYFATPREMITKGAGDCEDYAIMKMHLLAAMGFPAEDMYLTVGIYTYANGDIGGHAVLTIRFAGGLWVLDNMRNSIIPLQDYKQFEPLAFMNWDGYYLSGALSY